MAQSHGIAIKKKFSQHFLRDLGVVQRMCERAKLDKTSNVFEIGCGDGVLTREILTYPIQRLWVFEIDSAWAGFVKKALPDPRMTIFVKDFLITDFAEFESHKPWILLANLPYQITFPILHTLKEQRHLLDHGIIMMQEEVAQKIMKKSGRGYGYVSLFFQYYFEWQLLEKISPGAFHPPPQVYSRLMYFKPRANVDPIMDEQNFWLFIKACFKQPRRMLKNNLMQSHYDIAKIPEATLLLRAQQMNMQDFLKLWKIIKEPNKKS